jgi:ABC-type transporter Mla subunit MlaD
MEIDERYDLPEFVRATITSGAMLGDPYLEIRQAPEEDRFRRRRDEAGAWVIFGEAPTTLPELLADGRRILEDVKRFTGRLDVVGDTVERVVEGARRIVDDEKFRSDIHGTVASWRAAGDEVYGRVGAVADSATDALGHWRDAGATAHGAVARVGDRAETLVWRVDDIIARRGDTIAANFETFSDKIASDPAALVRGIFFGGGGGGRRPSSPTAY